MIYTNETKKALKLCFEAHKDQLDKSGMPYVFHRLVSEDVRLSSAPQKEYTLRSRRQDTW